MSALCLNCWSYLHRNKQAKKARDAQKARELERRAQAGLSPIPDAASDEQQHNAKVWQQQDNKGPLVPHPPAKKKHGRQSESGSEGFGKESKEGDTYSECSSDDPSDNDLTDEQKIAAEKAKAAVAMYGGKSAAQLNAQHAKIALNRKNTIEHNEAMMLLDSPEGSKGAHSHPKAKFAK